MNEPETASPTAAELATAETELPEWERLRVRDYWDAVVAEELGARPPRTKSPTRPEPAAPLRLVPFPRTSPENAALPTFDDEEAA